MAGNIAEVVDTVKVRSAEFVKLTVSTQSTSTTYTFSTSYKSETIDGVVYNPLGGLLSIGTQQRDLAATSFDTSISLVGVDPANVYLVLSSPIRGSEITIGRGFYDANGNLGTTSLRYTGIVTGYTLSEDRTMDMLTYNITLNCSNYKTVLENQIPGRFTNPTSWTQYYSNDTSMYNVPNLYGATFNFGKTP